MIITEIRTRQDLVELVKEIGFLPFFSGRIEGFSLEENVSYEAWYQGRWSGKIHWDAWDWKGEVLGNKELVYGKFFEKKAGFISKELFDSVFTILKLNLKWVCNPFYRFFHFSFHKEGEMPLTKPETSTGLGEEL